MKPVTVSLLAAVLLWGCASQPSVTTQQSNRVEVAAEEVARSETERIRQYAPVDLRRAQDRLAQAREALAAGDGELAEHLAYLAQRHAEIGRIHADTAAAKARADELAGTREQLRDQARDAVVSLQQRQIERLREQLEELNPRRTERGITLTFSNVLFRFDSAELTEAAQPPLDRLAAFLRQYPDQRVSIEGHTDSLGPEEYNRELAQRRAQSVADAMSARGIDAARMTIISYGESQPVASNETQAGRRQNRRVEFVIWAE